MVAVRVKREPPARRAAAARAPAGDRERVAENLEDQNCVVAIQLHDDARNERISLSFSAATSTGWLSAEQ